MGVRLFVLPSRKGRYIAFLLSVCLSLRVCLCVGRSVSRSVSWSTKFPFILFAQVVHTKMKFGLQIYHNNIWISFDFGYDRAIYDIVKSFWLQRITMFAVSVHVPRRSLEGRGHKCFINISCFSGTFDPFWT